MRATGCNQCWYSPVIGGPHQYVWVGYKFFLPSCRLFIPIGRQCQNGTCHAHIGRKVRKYFAWECFWFRTENLQLTNRSPASTSAASRRLFGVSRRYGQETLSKRWLWPWPCRDGTMAALACWVPTPNSPAIAFSFKFNDNDGRASWISISRRIQGIRDGVGTSSRWEFRNHFSCGLPRARAGHEGIVNEEEEEENALASCVEVAMGGSRYLHVMASSMHNVDHGNSFSFADIV